MTAPQATIFQYAACGCVVVWLIVILIMTWQLHKDKPKTRAVVEDEAYAVAYAAWQKTEATE
jgi:uncharacterized membrane protein